MKVKNIMFSGFAAAILMGVGAANAVVANPVTLADQGYVDAKVGQAEAAAKKHFDDKYDSTEKLTDLLDAKEDVANKVASDSNVDVSAMTPEQVNQFMADRLNENTKYPTVAAAQQIAQVVLKSVSSTAADVSDMKTKVTSLETVVGADANSGLQKAVADNTSAITKLNGDVDTEGSVDYKIAQAGHEAAGAAAQALADAKKYTDDEIVELNLSQYAKTADVAETYETKESAAAYAKTAEVANTYATKTEAEGYATAAVNALGIADYAKTAEVANTYATKTEAEGYATAAVNALGIADYAKTANVNAGLATKLDKTAIDEAAGTYMVTSDGAGNITYTKVRVATVDGEGNATVTE